MKKIISLIALAVALSLPMVLSAQNPPHPNGGNDPGTGNTPVGGPAGAPVGSGMVILTVLAAAWGGKKVYELHKEE